jgi:hypothetical protein
MPLPQPRLLPKPSPDEFAPYFRLYIDQVPETDLIEFLNRQRDTWQSELRRISEAQSLFRYAPGKWTIKEMLGHVNDTERIFSYRLLRIARGDQAPLPGFDQDPYVAAAESNQIDWEDLIHESLAVRQATIALLQLLPTNAWSKLGTASDHAISVGALAYMIAGHTEHHRRLLKEHPPN